MKQALFILCTLAFVSVAGFAQKPSVAPLSPEVLAAILGEPAVSGACPTPASGVLFAARRPAMPKNCSATAQCETGTVSCQFIGTGGSCTFADRNCDIGERGHVTCQGTTTNCPTACSCGSPFCCACDNTGGCFACCRCGGGSAVECSEECS